MSSARAGIVVVLAAVEIATSLSPKRRAMGPCTVSTFCTRTRGIKVRRITKRPRCTNSCSSVTR